MENDQSIIRRADASGVPLLLARLLLGGVFIYTGIEKIGHPDDFLKGIHLYDMLPERPPIFLNGTAIVLPWLEVLCGVALLLGVWVRGAAASIAAMLAVFTPAILLRAMAIRAAEGTPFMEIAFDCGCGTGVVIIWQKLLGNLGLLLVALFALFSRSRRFCLARWLDRRRPGGAFCRRCGYTLADREAEHCGPCAGLSGFPAIAAEGGGLIQGRGGAPAAGVGHRATRGA